MLQRFLCTWTNQLGGGGVLAVVASMKPIVGLDFSSSALKSCHLPPSLFSSVIESVVVRRTTTRQFSVWTVGWAAGLLTDARQSHGVAALLFLFVFKLLFCFVFCTSPPFIFSVRYFACRLFKPFPSTHDLGAAQTSARHWTVCTDWLTEEFSVLCCFSFTLCNSLDVFLFFFLRNFQGGFVPCLRLVMMMMMMMWVSCHWIQCSSVWPWLRPNLSSSDPQK